jgi:8-oxo-dGTP pyrophosphatase MutT (NUDIX family)
MLLLLILPLIVNAFMKCAWNGRIRILLKGDVRMERDAVFHVEHQVFNYRTVAVMIEKGHVLIHRSKKETHWSLPGGRVKLGDDAQSSLKREMMEELAVHAEVEKHLWTVENFFTYNEKEFHEVGLYFKVRTTENLHFHEGEEFIGEEGERLVYKWVPLDRLNDYELYPEAVKNKIIIGSFESDYIMVRDLQNV